jgi:hypothetical protein
LLETIINQITKDEPLMILLVGTFITLAMVIKAIASVLKTHAREKSRREIAAYIAEGTMTSEQGERLMKAGEHVAL